MALIIEALIKPNAIPIETTPLAIPNRFLENQRAQVLWTLVGMAGSRKPDSSTVAERVKKLLDNPRSAPATPAKAHTTARVRRVPNRSPIEPPSNPVNIPVSELAGRVAELGDKHKPVVVYCASGMRSANAAGILKRAGFAEVHDLGAAARWPGP